MKDIKNYLIAILAGLLVLTLTTQPSIGAGKSKEAKIVEYDNCIRNGSSPNIVDAQAVTLRAIAQCKTFQP